MFIVFGIVFIPILIIAGILLSGRGGFLIAGYNTMNAKNKENYNEKELCRAVGWFLIALTFFMMFIPSDRILK